MLDADEYMHLAIHASKEGDHHAALEHLHKAVELEPAHLSARYLLAAEHAELGLYERAYDEIDALLRLAPEMGTARFQQGLLALQLERQEEARFAFLTLSESSADDSLRAFATAYLYLLDDRRQDAIEQLSRGLSHCANAALTLDMGRVLTALSAENGTTESAPAAADNAPAVFLGAYGNSAETF